MEKIIEKRIADIKDELQEIFGEWFSAGYDYNEGMSIRTNDIDKVLEYVEWELENTSYDWKDRSERDKKEIIQLLSEYIKLKDNK
ncbi:MAG: hypothetical protein WCX73_05620 [Candidatus Pacearchaeota archaeon]